MLLNGDRSISRCLLVTRVDGHNGLSPLTTILLIVPHFRALWSSGNLCRPLLTSRSPQTFTVALQKSGSIHIRALHSGSLLLVKPAHGARVGKRKTMKTTTTLLMALALTLPVMNLSAQDNEAPNPPLGPRLQDRQDGDFRGTREGRPERGPGPDGVRPRGPRAEGQRPEGNRPPEPPLLAALDGNHDGVIDQAEIDNASAALKSLDKNHDGKLSREELRPPQVRPQARAQFEGRRDAPRQFRYQEMRRMRRPDGPPPGDEPRPPHPPEDRNN